MLAASTFQSLWGTRGDKKGPANWMGLEQPDLAKKNIGHPVKLKFQRKVNTFLV